MSRSELPDKGSIGSFMTAQIPVQMPSWVAGDCR